MLGCIHCEVAPASVGEKFQVSGGAMPAIGGSGFYPGEGNLSGLICTYRNKVSIFDWTPNSTEQIIIIWLIKFVTSTFQINPKLNVWCISKLT